LLALLLCAALPASTRASDLTDRLDRLALRGNPEALYHLGMIYHVGLEGVGRDPRRAFDYFRRAAEGGDALGAYKVGCYYAGQGEGVVASDPPLALRYKLIAAEAGYVLAQMDVAQIHAGRGERDRALHWYDAAARQGDWSALFMAYFQVMPESPHPDRPRAWLYFEVMNRTLAQIPASDMPAEEARSMRAGLAEIRRAVETGMSQAERAEGARLLAQWRVERSPVSLRADLGLNAARRLVGLPDAP
jgi:TPR repeat protein